MVYEQGVRSTNSAVRVEGIKKSFGDTHALRGVDLDVPAGSVLGMLGHNGAGKTTMLRILTTLTRPDAGRAWVAGHDVIAEPARVREKIGVAGQAATVDGLLGVRMNLELVGRLYHMTAQAARKRADELLERVSLADVATKRTDTLSGGMRRRLDLAAAIVASPPVLFLDEPTTGLDPHARNELWALLREQVKAGATLVLTTQYLEEADRLADQIVLLDQGAVAARGTPAELKAKVGGDRLVVTLDPINIEAARGALTNYADGAVNTTDTQIELPLKTGVRLIDIVRALDAAGIDARDIAHRQPSLDDVFLSMTQTKSHKKEAA